MKAKLLAFLLLISLMSGMVPAIPMAAALDISQPEPTVVTVPAEMLRWSEYNPTQLRGVKKEWLNTLEEGTLVRLIIPAQATSIYKFYVAQDGFVDRLYSVDFTQATNLTDIDHSLFMDCKNLEEVIGFEDLHLNEVPKQTFLHCKKLKRVFDFSNTNITSIGNNAFYGSGITGIILPDGLKSIGASSISECNNLKYIRTTNTKDNDTVLIDLPDSLESIGPYAIKLNQGPLRDAIEKDGITIELPTSLTSAGNYAFVLGGEDKVFFSFPERWTATSSFSQIAFSAFTNHILVFPDLETYQAGKSHFTGNNYTVSRAVDIKFEGTDRTEKKLYGASVKYVYDETERWHLDDSYTLPAPPADAKKPANGYRSAWTIDKIELTNTSDVTAGNSKNRSVLTAIYVTDLLTPPTNIRFTINGVPQNEEVVDRWDKLVTEVPASGDAPGKLGVALEHPLLKDKDTDTAPDEPYVYFKYLWYDVQRGSVGGERQAEEGFYDPGKTSSENLAKARLDDEITISPKDERVYQDVHDPGGTASNYNFYWVKIIGYYVDKAGMTSMFYQSYCPEISFSGPADPLGETTKDVYGSQIKVVPPTVTYTVTYDLDGGTDTGIYGPVTVKAGESVAAADAPSKEGFVFTAWSDGQKKYQPGDLITVNASMTLKAQWETNSPVPATFYIVAYDLNGGTDTGIYGAAQVLGGQAVTLAAAPSRSGYSFTGWSDGTTIYQAGASITVHSNMNFTAQWSKDSSTGGGSSGGSSSHTTHYTLHYESNGGSKYKDERYPRNTVAKLKNIPTREGYTFTGWYGNDKLTERLTEVKMTSNKTVYAGWEATGVPDWLNGDSHFAYVGGYPDGMVKPLNNITRAEVASIFFRLLNKDIRDRNLTVKNTFGDVTEGVWYNTSVSTMEKLGVIKGRSAERFDPNVSITRAEFAAICARFDTTNVSAGSNFTDLSGHWAKTYIERASNLGWIRGYSDGTFQPDKHITRAEAMTMINRMLNRLPETEADLLEGMKVWPDNRPGDWYYIAVQEATNSHEFVRKDQVHERWVKLISDPTWWTKYEI